MPIKQERMIALITAARDYVAALDDAQAIIKNALVRIRTGEISHEQACMTIETLVVPKSLLNDPINSAKIIALEWMHFQKTKHKNNYERRKLAERRANDELGIPRERKERQPPTSHSPDSIVDLAVNDQSAFNSPRLDIGPEVMIATQGETLSPDRKSQLDREVEEVMKKMGG